MKQTHVNYWKRVREKVISWQYKTTVSSKRHTPFEVAGILRALRYLEVPPDGHPQLLPSPISR